MTLPDTLRFVDAAHEGERMRGKSVAVFGGSSGIGFATAALAVQECAETVFLIAQNARQLESAATVLRGLRRARACGPGRARVETVRADVSARAEVAEAFRSFARVLGEDARELSTVVNTAGIAGYIGVGLADVPDAVLHSKFDPILNNLYGAIHITSEAIRFWNLTDDNRAAPPSLVHLSSENGLSPCPGCALYGISKAGLISLSRSVAAFFDDGGDALPRVRVNVVAPGLVDTPLTWNQVRGTRLSRDGSELEHFAQLQTYQCLDADARIVRDGTCKGGGTGEGCPCEDERARDPRLPVKYGAHLWPAIDPRDVGDAVLFLASDASSRVSGTTLVLDNNRTTVRPARRDNTRSQLATAHLVKACPASTIELCPDFGTTTHHEVAPQGQLEMPGLAVAALLLLLLSHAAALMLGVRIGRRRVAHKLQEPLL